MDFLENPNVKNRYNKYKYRLKKWENEFMEKYGRPPSKVIGATVMYLFTYFSKFLSHC